jgi:two-component system sensor histidine kinase PilS (NtrC family)
MGPMATLSALPESIPLPPAAARHLLRREAFLLLFCAAFAGALFLLWKWIENEPLAGVDEGSRVAYRNLQEILAPFLTAYVAARVYSGMVSRYERQLQRHRLLLAHILDTSVDGILTLDEEDRVSTWNHGAEQIFGWKEEEILGQHAARLYPPGYNAQKELDALRRGVDQRGVLRAHSGERITRDGRPIRCEISSTVLRDGHGRYAGRASIVRDVTERDRIREELNRRESLAAIGEMAAAVAHEIKNPLAGIAGAVQVLGRGFPAGDERAEVVAEIQRQVRRLDETIRDLLTFARPPRPRPAALELKEFAERILRALAEEPDLKRHRIELRIPPGTVVRADPQLLENVLLNLLLNAGQALGARAGRIELRAVEQGERTRLSVADDGPGIAEDVLPRLFKPFFTTKAQGTGLGLAIVRSFVSAMGGRIEVHTGPGQGTSFTVVLPRPKEPVRA